MIGDIENQIELERGVLAGIASNPAQLPEIEEHIGADDFVHAGCRAVFMSLSRLCREGQKIDLTVLAEDLRGGNAIEELGGYPFLADLVAIDPTGVWGVQRAKKLRERTTFRQLAEVVENLTREVGTACEDPLMILDRYQGRLLELGAGRKPARLATAAEALDEALHQLELRQDGRTPPGLRTGFIDLDDITGGMQPGQLIVLAARTGLGKSSLASNVAVNVALEAGRVLVFSLEMGRLELVDRMLSSLSGIGLRAIRQGQLDNASKTHFDRAAEVFRNFDMSIDEESTRTPHQIAGTARRLRRRSGLDLIVVDYLQLLNSDASRNAPATSRSAKSRGGSSSSPWNSGCRYSPSPSSTGRARPNAGPLA